MNMRQESKKMDRRTMILFGLAGASALFVGRGPSVLAQGMEKVDRKTLKEAPSMIPGFSKVQLRAITYQPGATSKNTMKNAMICECTQGTLEITQADGKPFTVKRGDIWT